MFNNIFFSLCLSVIFIIPALQSKLFAQGRVIDRIVAVVGNSIILQSELENELMQIQAQEYLPSESSRCEILENQLELLGALKKAVFEKREALVKVSAEETEMATKKEEALIREIASIEKARSTMFETFADSMGTVGSTLSEIAISTGEPYRTKLNAMTSELKSIAAEISQANDINAQLAAQSFAHSKTILSMLAAGSGPETYGKRSLSVPNRTVSSLVLDRRV